MTNQVVSGIALEARWGVAAVELSAPEARSKFSQIVFVIYICAVGVARSAHNFQLLCRHFNFYVLLHM